MQPIYESYKKCVLESIPQDEPAKEDFFLHIAEYVGANTSINLKKYAKLIKEYSRPQHQTFRMWAEMSWKHKDKIKFHPVSKGYLATSRGLDELEEICQTYHMESGFHEKSRNYYVITEHKGSTGIYIPAFLRMAIKESKNSNMSADNQRFLRDILRAYESQDEVLLFTKRRITDKNIIGYYDPEDEQIEYL